MSLFSISSDNHSLPLSGRAVLHYLVILGGLILYGGEVCPLMDDLSVVKLALALFAPLLLGFAIRQTAVRRLVDKAPLTRRAPLQFKLDLTIYILAGLGAGLINRYFYGLPLLQSGLKLPLGTLTLGLFASLDLALARERLCVKEAAKTGFGRKPPKSYQPLTRRFAWAAATILCLSAAVLTAVLLRDFHEISLVSGSPEALGPILDEITLEILFIMAMLTALVLWTIHSYSINLRLLLGNQATVLEHVGNGDLGAWIPAVTRDELGVIAGRTNFMIEELKDRERMKRSLEAARIIQLRLLPEKPPFIPGFVLAGTIRFCDETGGDYYDFVDFHERDSGHGTAILVGDVTGHGIDAALFMATARSMIRSCLHDGGSLGERMSAINELLCRDVWGTGLFMTLFCLVVRTDGSLAWVGAGHDPALVYLPEDDDFLELKGLNLPLGVEGAIPYEMSERKALPPGAVAVLATDGVWEARDARGEMFGKERLRNVLAEASPHGAEEIAERVLLRLDEFRGEVRLQDDVTLVVLKALGKG